MIVVSDTTAISCLLKIQKLDLLSLFSQDVYLPGAVWQELTRLQQKGYDLSPIQTASWIKIEPVVNTALVETLRIDLDARESEAIALAIEKGASFLLIDEKDGRAKASELGIPTIGLVGVLLTLKQNGLIPVIKPLLDELINTAGFYLSDRFYAKILASTNE
jgi:uncharacterized protein